MIRIRHEEVVGWEERRFGELVHRALEAYFSGDRDLTGAVDRAVGDMLPYGLREEFRERLLSLFGALEASEGFGALLRLVEGAQVFCEVPILGERGQRFRVDLFLRRAGGSAVVDYKVSSPRQDHAEQVRRYAEILSRGIGEDVKGYLFYISSDGSGHLERVI